MIAKIIGNFAFHSSFSLQCKVLASFSWFCVTTGSALIAVGLCLERQIEDAGYRQVEWTAYPPTVSK